MRENTKGDRPHIYTGVEPSVKHFFFLVLTSMSFNDFSFLLGNEWWFFENLLKLSLVLYKIPFFHSSFLYSRH